MILDYIVLTVMSICLILSVILVIKLIQIDCGEKINGQFKTIDDQIKDAKYI